MASAGLLGFIGGVSKTIADEYDRQKEIGKDINEENRAEERAIRAEQRREAAERRAADYRKQLDLEYAPRQVEVEAEAEVGLIKKGRHPQLELQRQQEADEAERIKSGEDPTVLREDVSAAQEAERIRAGRDPAVLREEQSDIEKAARIRGGALTDPEQAAIEAGTSARKTQEDEAARRSAEREDERIRRAEGLSVPGASSVDLTFKPSEVSKQLNEDLKSLHGIDLVAIHKRMQPGAGGSRLQELRLQESTIGEVLSDDMTKNELREEIIVKLHSNAERQLKQAAKTKQITNLEDVTELSNVIVQQADVVMENIEQAHIALQQARTPEQRNKIIGILEENMADAWGEKDKKPDKRSPAFQSMWNTFRKSLSS